jgi:predicted translin family RNA/ssDNA-binding protein
LKDSLEIVESYSKFLSDTSQTEVENAKQNIDTIKEEIEKTTINCDIPDFLTQEDKENIKTAKETIKNLQKKLVISIQNNKLEE